MNEMDEAAVKSELQAAWQDHVDNWDAWWGQWSTDQESAERVDQTGREAAASLGYGCISPRGAEKLYKCPPKARALTRGVDQRFRAVLAAYPGGVRCRIHRPRQPRRGRGSPYPTANELALSTPDNAEMLRIAREVDAAWKWHDEQERRKERESDSAAGDEAAQDARVGGSRGTIVEFSEASRRRLLAKLQAVDWAAGSVYFCTLTWHTGAGQDAVKWKDQLQAFTERLFRSVYGDKVAAVIWRLETKRRKQGLERGMVRPHYHLLIFWSMKNGPRLERFRAWVASNWHAVADPTSSKHEKMGTDVVRAKNQTGPKAARLLMYVAKYCAKRESLRLTDVESGKLLGVGRLWGIMREKTLPTACIGCFTLDHDQLVGFLAHVHEYGRAVHSWYLGALSDRWATFAIMGDGDWLLRKLCGEIDLELIPGSTWTGNIPRPRYSASAWAQQSIALGCA